MKEKNRQFFRNQHKNTKKQIFSILFIATKQTIGLNIITPNQFPDLRLYTNVKYAYNRNPDIIECDEMKSIATFSINFFILLF